MIGAFVGGTRRAFERTLSVLVSGLGFLVNVVVDLRTGGRGRRTQWMTALTRLETYLENSGIGNEMSSVLNRRFLTNLTIYDDVQKALGHQRMKECELPDGTSKPSPERAAHFMRYATAVYGPSMIDAVLLETEDDEEEERRVRDAPEDAATTVLAYVGVADAEDAVVMDVSEGASMDCLRHFVAVDRVQKALVFAVRGTFSVSELVTDLVGFTEPFCGGEAHAAMADMAKKTWEAVREPLLAKLTSLPTDYELVITGHSLGAGVACLINILIRHTNAVPAAYQVRCFAYAPPPVFCPLDKAPGAVASTVAFVHDNDVVPFLSVHAVRRFLIMMRALDSFTKHLWTYETVAIDWELRAPPNDAVETVRKAETEPMTDIKGAARAVIPASVLYWLRPNDDDGGGYSCHACDPSKAADLSILMDGPSIIGDHMPPMYEVALRNLR